MPGTVKVVVVGGGLIGLATAYALRRFPRVEVVVCEKETEPGMHQSTHNSGVLHAGLYYKPGSSKATLSVRGIRMMTEYAAARGVAHEICGKLVVATDDHEVPALRRLFDRGQGNGLRGVAWLDAAAATAIEPHVKAVAAVQVPDEGIIDYAGVVAALAADIRASGGRIACGSQVIAAAATDDGWEIETSAGTVPAHFVINCAGLQSDRVGRIFGARSSIRIVPFRGEYYTLARPELCKNLIYPVPDPNFPFLGVHFTRMIGGGVECGPNAVLALSREGYRRRAWQTRDALDAAGYVGLWRFIARYFRATAFELRRSLSSAVMLRSLQRLVPDVTAADLRPGQVGIRAQAMRPDGTLVEDFEFVPGRNALHVLNAPSPGATASLAIGEEIVARAAALAGWAASPATP